MAKEKYKAEVIEDEPEDLGLKIQTQEGSLWEKMVEQHKRAVKQCKDELIIQEAYLLVAEEKAKAELEKLK